MSFSKSGMKIEGTSQTYGQLIVSTMKNDASINVDAKDSISTLKGPVTSQDIIVDIVSMSDAPSEEFTFTDTDRTKIAIAAFSNNAKPTVYLNSDVSQSKNIVDGAANISAVQQRTNFSVMVVGSTFKTRDEISKVMAEAQKTDMLISIKSRMSDAIEINNLKEVRLEGDFNYNFYSPQESDVVSEEDPAQDPYLTTTLDKVPRYVELHWNPVTVTEDLSKDNFYKGASILKYFEQSNAESYIVKDGIKMKVTDLHDLESAFDAIANKDIFNNTIETIIDVRDNFNVLSFIPVVKK